MFEQSIRQLEVVVDYVSSLYTNKPNEKMPKSRKVELDDLQKAINLLKRVSDYDFKEKLFRILADNFRFNAYNEYTQIADEQFIFCINEILKELGIENK